MELEFLPFGLRAAMKLIAGLGNPGAKYSQTRHNAGFMALDVFADRHGLPAWREKYDSRLVKTRLDGVDAVFLKPGSFMNLSGGPIRAAMKDFGADTSGLLVIHDDIDLPLGQARHKIGGGHGGHNGLRSIIGALGSPDFHRIRIGAGRPPAGMDAADYVLSRFRPEEEDAFLDGLDEALELLESKFLGLTVR